MLYFSSLPYDLLRILLYYFNIKDLNNALRIYNLFDMPEFSRFLKDKKLWTYFYKRDIDSTYISGQSLPFISYCDMLRKIGDHQRAFIKSLMDTGDQVVRSYIDSNLIWCPLNNVIDILREAINAKNRSLAKYQLTEFDYSNDEKQEILKMLCSSLEKSWKEITSKTEYIKDDIVIDLLPLLPLPHDPIVISNFYCHTAIRKSFRLFECLVDNGYPMYYGCLYTCGELTKFLEIMIKKNVKINLDKLMPIIDYTENTKTIEMLIAADYEINEKHIKKFTSDKIKNYFSKRTTKRRKLN